MVSSNPENPHTSARCANSATRCGMANACKQNSNGVVSNLVTAHGWLVRSVSSFIRKSSVSGWWGELSEYSLDGWFDSEISRWRDLVDRLA